MAVTFRFVWPLAALLCLYCSAPPSVHAQQPAAAAPSDTEFRTFLRKHCLSCHDDATAAAKLSLESLRLESLPLPGAELSRWIPVYDKLRLGQMPPADAPQPAPAERRRMSEWLRQRLHNASLALQQTEGRVVLRRLNRTEYQTTLADLLGVQLDVKELLPSDNVAAGFDNVSAVLDVSSAHLLRYQDAAEKALSQIVPRQPQRDIRSRLNGREVLEKSKQSQGMHGKSLRLDGDALILGVRPYGHITFGTATAPQTGRYRVRASLQAINTQGQPLPVRFTAGWDWGRNEKAETTVRDASAEKPTEIEIEVDLNFRELVEVHAWSLPTERERSEQKSKRPLEEIPSLAIQWLEISGPLDPWPPLGYTRLFGDLPLKAPYRNGPLFVGSDKPREDADRLLRSFLPVAFRRPVSAELHNYYLQIVLDALDRKRSFEDAMLLGYRAALCSPHFLFLTEPLHAGPIQAGSPPGRLDDYAVAARLSYFLWSTLPDRELLDLAEKGELTKPVELRRQVERLLSDSRSRRFTDNFAGQWLDLRQINATTPDPNAYGQFDDFLYWSMPRETTRFFEEILEADRSLTEFVQSDWTFLNERLAKHYGVPGVFGGELRKVKLPEGSHRGGVITQASIMKVTADGTKTSPVLRGKWVLERILGQPPAPPPPNVSAIEPDIRGATTIREQLDKHRNIASCAACHRHIDPPGFALESFDVIGGWRDFYRAKDYSRDALVELPNYPGRRFTRGPAIDAAGETPDGRKFGNIDQYKTLLLADQDQLARNLAEKLLIYATGADIQFADRAVVEQLVAQSRARQHGFRSLLHDVVQSPIFLRK